MRIAFLTTEFTTEPNFAGGLAQYLGRVTRGLVERGHHVEVFVTADACETLKDGGVIVHRVKPKKWLPLRCGNCALAAIGRPRLGRLQLAYSTALGLSRAFNRRASMAGFDIVQAASWLGTGYFVSSNPWAPVIVRASSFEPLLAEYRGQDPSLDEKLYRRFEVAAMRRAAAVYAPSNFLAGEIRRIAGIESHVVTPPYCSSDGATADTGEDPLGDWSDYAVFFGKVAKYKGAGLLADAIAPLLCHDKTLRIAFAGPIENDAEAGRLLTLAESLPESVRYLGTPKHADLMRIVKRARCVILPSLMDNLPNTCFEAMARQKVVIGPDGVSFDELIVDGKSGFLFRRGDPVSLRQTIMKAWRLDDEKLRAIGREAHAKIQQMSPAATLRDLERFYTRVIEQTTKRWLACERRPAKQCSLP